jgi:hypothetical protein
VEGVIAEQDVWLFWSSAFLAPWLAAYAAFPRHRKAMWWASLFTTPFGLTEPLFVPEYWNPPSLFDLARTTGFDIESLIFCFGIGGIGAVLYNLLTGRGLRAVAAAARRSSHHRLHRWALATPFISFPILYPFPWNPIYPSIIAMLLGAIAAIHSRLHSETPGTGPDGPLARTVPCVASPLSRRGPSGRLVLWFVISRWGLYSKHSAKRDRHDHGGEGQPRRRTGWRRCRRPARLGGGVPRGVPW